jgi:hypothetical protein
MLVYLVTLSSFFFFSLLVYTHTHTYLLVDGLLAEHDFCQGYCRFDAQIYSMIFLLKKRNFF